MAPAQRPISWLLRVYNFATAHLPIIYVQQTDQLLHNRKSSKYLITVHREMAWQLLIAYFEIFRRFIRLLCKAKFFGYCASYYYFASAHLPIICLLQIDQYFHHWKSSKYLVTLHRNIVWQLQMAYLETFQRFIWLLRKPNFLPTMHHTIIFLLRISKLYVYCK